MHLHGAAVSRVRSSFCMIVNAIQGNRSAPQGECLAGMSTTKLVHPVLTGNAKHGRRSNSLLYVTEFRRIENLRTTGLQRPSIAFFGANAKVK